MQPWHAHVFSVVSKATQTAVEKIIYENLFLTSRERAWDRKTRRLDFPQTAVIEKILPTFQSRSTNFFAATVKNVLFDVYASDDRDVIELILKKCTGIRILAYWIYDSDLAGPWILSSAHTLECFWVTAEVFEEALVNCQVVLPALKKMHLTDLDEHWQEHVEFVISIAPNLQYMLLRGEPWYLEDIEEWMEGRSDTFTIELQDDSSDSEDDVNFLHEWLLTIGANIPIQ
ncbi:hypothetical protein C0993_004949 [Termitomyces sp. T159_Od127]|nr:hypothetical protein C0993_004949 [Termitomyces sp. T159_Od127]